MKKVLIALTALAVLGCSGEAPKEKPAKDHTVVYKVTGDSSNVSVRYDNATGATNEETVRPPWSKTVKVKPGGYVFMSATNEDEYSEKLGGEVLVDGKSFQKASADKKYGGVTVSGYLDQ